MTSTSQEHKKIVQPQSQPQPLHSGQSADGLDTRAIALRQSKAGRFGEGTNRKLKSILWACIPAIVFVVIVVAWDLAVRIYEIPSYLLPGPLDVFTRLFTQGEIIWGHTTVTLSALLMGFALSVLIGIPLGLLLSLSRVAKQVLYQPVMVMQLIPKIAIAPLLLVWLGYGPSTKVMLVVLISFFPLLLASMAGFAILDTRLLYLTKSMGATVWQTFWYLRVPAAMPVIFSGIKTSATLAVTAVIVAEFLGSNDGLGYALLRASGVGDTAYMFAVLVVLTLVGIVINYIIELIEWLVTPWQRRGRQG